MWVGTLRGRYSNTLATWGGSATGRLMTVVFSSTGGWAGCWATGGSSTWVASWVTSGWAGCSAGAGAAGVWEETSSKTGWLSGAAWAAGVASWTGCSSAISWMGCAGAASWTGSAAASGAGDTSRTWEAGSLYTTVSRTSTSGGAGSSSTDTSSGGISSTGSWGTGSWGRGAGCSSGSKGAGESSTRPMASSETGAMSPTRWSSTVSLSTFSLISMVWSAEVSSMAFWMPVMSSCRRLPPSTAMPCWRA